MTTIHSFRLREKLKTRKGLEIVPKLCGQRSNNLSLILFCFYRNAVLK